MAKPKASPSKRFAGRNGLLLSLLGLLIAVEAFTVVVVLTSQRYATDQALRDYTHELLQNVVDETRENAVGYLRQAEDSVSLAVGVYESGLLSASQRLKECRRVHLGSERSASARQPARTRSPERARSEGYQGRCSPAPVSKPMTGYAPWSTAQTTVLVVPKSIPNRMVLPPV